MAARKKGPNLSFPMLSEGEKGARREVPPRVRDGLRTAIVNLRWLSRAIEDGASLERAIGEVYSMKIYGFAGDLRTLLKEVDK